MKLTRQSRIITALITLCGLLFMQLAVAAYACPSMQVAPVAMTPAADHSAMAGCHGMDKVQPSLCYAHGDTGNQSLDKPALPHIQPFIASSTVGLTDASNVADANSRLLAIIPASSPLARITAPPLSIRNCCFRI